ncbi:MAG: DALR domain-containing protein [Rhodospirillaceae bacterium]
MPEAGARAVPQAITDALCDDLNTPKAVSEMHEIASDLNKASAAAEIARLKEALLGAGDALGLLVVDPEHWFQGAGSGAGEGGDGPTSDEIEALIAARKQARKDKDFAKADGIRDDLKAQGIILEDGPGGTTWKRG